MYCKKYNVVGGVYTQWTDVETEINGLMTYDRIEKVPLSTLKRLSDELVAGYFKCNPARWSGAKGKGYFGF